MSQDIFQTLNKFISVEMRLLFLLHPPKYGADLIQRVTTTLTEDRCIHKKKKGDFFLIFVFCYR